ncbi:sialin-like [Diadema setosum]|uniref:sialin-like n=1 Tax=Diadema setosum TaxID=31175 RepID=UPI003B3B7400
MRWFFAFISFLGVTVCSMMRVNVSVAMAIMAKASHVTSNSSEAMSHDNSNSTIDETEFDWSSKTQELLIAAFWIGYTLMQIPSGYLADRIGGKWLMSCGVSVSAIFNILGPIAARNGVAIFFFTRCCSGLGEGVLIPCVATMVNKWSPAQERTRLMSFVTAALAFGTAAGQSLSGVICRYLGWPISFYIHGAIGLAWVASWVVLVYEEPSLHPCISDKEKDYIEKHRSYALGVSSRVRPPIVSMLTSLPAVALFVCMFTAAGVVYLLLLTNLPLYMKHVIGFDIMAVGLLSSLPYICHWLMLQVSSHVSDSLIGRNLLSRTMTRKLMADLGIVILIRNISLVMVILQGAIITAGGLILVCTQVSTAPSITVLLMTIAAGGIGISFSTAFVNAIDLAPIFSGTLTGIANFIAVSSGFMAPLVVGALTQDQNDSRGWHIVFYGIAAVDLFGALFFHAFGSGDVQEWAVVAEEEKNANDVTRSDHECKDGEGYIALST